MYRLLKNKEKTTRNTVQIEVSAAEASRRQADIYESRWPHLEHRMEGTFNFFFFFKKNVDIMAKIFIEAKIYIIFHLQSKFHLNIIKTVPVKRNHILGNQENVHT